MQASPQWSDGTYVNPQPMINDWWRSVTGLFDASPHVSPEHPVPTIRPTRAALRASAPTDLRVTWLGHSTVLLEIDGLRILTDPIWSERASPLSWLGPSRWFAPPIALVDLPRIDAVVISHDHYDHLDWPTILAMRPWRRTKFVVPLGLGAHLAYWGVPDSRIVELDWWERTSVGDGSLSIVCTPARHATGRMLIDDDSKLWAGFAFVGPRHRAYYSGDTGLFPAMRDIGRRLGPFDLTIIEVGQYGEAWPDWHLGPEQAVRAHAMVRGRVMLPVHWATFALAYHGWTEPIERTVAAAEAARVTLITPRPGESVEPRLDPRVSRWWPEVPWFTAAEAPIVSTQME